MAEREARHGDIVEVKSPAEILATLDDDGTLDGLPFMPEMLQYCGRRLTVEKRAEKLCDMIYPLASRKLPDAVLLEDLRCDGSGHDGCQAECRIFWKEAWLRPIRAGRPSSIGASSDPIVSVVELLARNAKRTTEVDGQVVTDYTCQATEMHRATQPLGRWDPRPIVREYTSGNVRLGTFLRVAARALIWEPLRVLGLRPKVPLRGSGNATKPAPLGLQPGDTVQVRLKEEIAETLNAQGFNRGLWFDEEMLPHCGGRYRVRQRIRRFIDEHTGKLVELKTDAVTLEGVVCSGERSPVRWFCPRGSYPFWRESWLRPMDQGEPETPDRVTEAPDDLEQPVDAVFHHPVPPDRG